MTIKHGQRRTRVFTTGEQPVVDVIVGYYHVQSNGDRIWIGSTLQEAAIKLERLPDKAYKGNWWIDYCFGRDVNGDLAWSNLDYTNDIM